jgi:hypothetical protein
MNKSNNEAPVVDGLQGQDEENRQIMYSLLNAQVVYGLQGQGHIPTIEKLLADGKNWEEIAQVIGWCPITAREHYEKFLNKDDEISSLLARAVEMLRKIGNKPETPVWDRNSISEFILRAEYNLKSAPINIHPILKQVQ